MLLTKNFFMIILHVIALLVFIMLGSWQLYRLEWKKNIINNFINNSNKLISNFDTNSDINSEEFATKIFYGKFENTKTLFRLSTLNNKVGYDVFTLFVTTDSRNILVNRGWVPQKDKDNFTPHNIQASQIIGMVIKEPRKSFFTPKNTFHDNILISINVDEISSYWDTSLEKFYVFQKDSNDSALVSYNFSPNFHNYHLVYAIIWFVLAGVTILFFLCKFRT